MLCMTPKSDPSCTFTKYLWNEYGQKMKIFRQWNVHVGSDFVKIIESNREIGIMNWLQIDGKEASTPSASALIKPSEIGLSDSSTVKVKVCSNCY